MKKLLILVGLAALLIVFVSAIAAEDSLPNDPNVNVEANACYTGGALEGKCGDDLEMWTGGWYMIRYQYNMVSFDQVPVAYQWMLPVPEPEEVAVEVVPTKESTCPPFLPGGVPAGSRGCDPCGFSVLPTCLRPD